MDNISQSTLSCAKVSEMNLLGVDTPTNSTEYPKTFNPLRRRFSVSAEPVTDVPANAVEAAAAVQAEILFQEDRENTPTPNQEDKLRCWIAKDPLFKSLTPDQISSVASALTERRYPAGATIVREGDEGSDMFIVGDGEVSVYDGQEKIANLTAGMSFGDVALMYNCPRSATVKASTNCTVWALESKPFKRIVMATSIQKRAKYEHFLSRVDLLKHLSPFERAKLADVLEPVEFEAYSKIVTQGETNASTFFIVEKGVVHVFKRDPENPSSPELFVREYHPGDYFGELALMKPIARQATCVAYGPVRCLVLSREHFHQVLSRIEERLAIAKYPSYGELVAAAAGHNTIEVVSQA